MCPLVSIIIPTFNRAGFLCRCINSCLSQTCKDIEIIVVDDASTDTTSDYILSLRDKRLKYRKHAANRGPAAARNTGLKTAQGEYIAFFDSDDEWYPKRSRDVMKAALLAGCVGFLAHSFLDTQLYSLQLSALFWILLGMTAAKDENMAQHR